MWRSLVVGVTFVVWMGGGNLAGTGSRKTGRRAMRDSKYEWFLQGVLFNKERNNGSWLIKGIF